MIELSGCRKTNVGASPTFHEVTILQEFQYGKDVFQATTNDRALPKRQQSFGYGNIVQ